VTVLPGFGPVTILGTSGDDTITLIARDSSTHAGADGVQDFTTTVNAGVEVLWLDVASVSVQAGSGADRVVVLAPAPNGAVWNVAVSVDGGPAPAGSDLLVVGTPASTDTVIFSPTGVSSGTLTILNLATVIAITGVEEVVYDGEAGGDYLEVRGTSGNDVVVHRPGVAGDEGQIWVGSLLPLRYEDLGAGGLVLIDGLAGQDELLYEGTAGADRFVVAGGQVVLNARVPVEPVDVEVWRLAGLSGADRFEVTAQAGVTVVVEGDGSGGGDVLVFTGSGGAVTVDLGAGSIEDAGVPGSPDVLFRGVVVVEVDASGGAFTLVGTAADDRLEVYPLGASEGVIRAGGLLPEVRYEAVAGGTISVDAAGGSDVVAVYGSQASDLITASASQVTLLGQTINLANLETLELLGAGGEDEFQVTAGPVEIRVDGGDPIGTTPGDRLVLVGPGGGVTFEPGPSSDSGALVVAGQRRVSFVRIEGVTVLPGFGPVTILGTSGDDTITLIARDSSTHAGADGVQDFTTTVNAGVEVLWLDVASVSVQAGSGADRVVVLAPAPNGAVWNVAVSVDGGPAPAGSDLLVVGTPASTDTVIFSPTGVSSGTLTILNLATVIAITGVEEVIYDGEAGGDYLEVRGTSGNDVVVHRPGVAGDEGQIWVGSLLPLRYEDLGAGGLVVVDGLAGTQDLLIYEGTAASDTFTAAGSQIDLNNRIPLRTVNVENWRLRGLAGDDVFQIVPMIGINVFVDGDEPGQSDTLLFQRNPAGVAQVVIFLDATPAGDHVQRIVQPGMGFVQLSGIETARVDVATGDLYVSGTRAEDVITFVPLSTHSGVITALGVPTQYQFLNVPEGTNQFMITGGPAGLGGPPGGGFADKVVVHGTSGNDLIRVNAATRTVQVAILGFGYPAPILANWRSVRLDNGTSPLGFPGIIEVVDVLGGSGADTFHVVPAPAVGNGLYINLDGGGPHASDALLITNLDAANNPVPLAASDFVVLGKSRTPDAGNVIVFRNAVRMPGISYRDVEVVYPNVAGGDNLLILGPDMYEENEFRQTAADLGTAGVINVRSLAIFPNSAEHPGIPADRDWFAVRAQHTGIMDITISFRVFPTTLLPSGGQLTLEVVDATGTVIAGNGMFGTDGMAGGFGVSDTDADARVRFPVVAGQTYSFRVRGSDDLVINAYNLTVINEAVPVPYDLELRDIVEQGVVVAGFTTTTFNGSPGLSSEDGFYTGKHLTFLIDPGNGMLQAHRRLVVGYVGATRTFTLDAPLPVVPPAGATFMIESFDTGRSQFDNVTRDNTPIIYLRLDDAGLLWDLPGNWPQPDNPPDEPIRIPFNPDQTRDSSTPGYRVAVFVEGAPQQSGTSPQQLIGFARALDVDGDGIPDGIYVFDFGRDAINPADPNGPTTAFVLTNGSHFISARVQIVDVDDPDNNPATRNNLTGFGPRSASLEIVVDTEGPPVTFGFPAVVDLPGTPNLSEADGLAAASDSGVTGLSGTFVDKVTNVTRPTFWGVAEAGTLVRLYADLNGDGILQMHSDLLLGQTTAIPAEGTNQFLPGMWTITSNIDLNDPNYFPVLDGVRTLFVVAEDAAGNLTPPDQIDRLQIFVDSRGPQLYDPDGSGPRRAIHITDDPTTSYNESTFDLFDPKPTQRPTPLVNALDIHIRDLPSRLLAGQLGALLNWNYPALASVTGSGDPASDPGLFEVRGDANGIIPILRVELIPNPLGPTVSGSVVSVTHGGRFRGNAALQAQDGVYEGLVLQFTSGPLAGQARVITGYQGNTRTFEFDRPFDAAPTPGSAFVIYPAATATIRLVFRDPGPDGLYNTFDDIGAPLPDDRFTLTISDSLVDPAGNKLDGESNASQPLGGFQTPTGDGVPGGAFVARFTVDSRPELGVWSAGSVYVDTNGNFLFDPTNADHVNRDITYVLGFATDTIFAGNFAFNFGPDGIPFTADDGPAVADGFHKLAGYGRDNLGRIRWVIDVNNDGVADLRTFEPIPLAAGFSGVGHPVAGNFDGVAANGDEIGLFDGRYWWLDTNRNFIVSDQTPIDNGLRGYPIVGDFDGDGRTDLATYLNGVFYFDLEYNGFGATDASFAFSPYLSFIGKRERPVAADFNQDGVTDLGLWVPDRSGQVPGEGGEWYILVSTPTAGFPNRAALAAAPTALDRLAWLNHEFRPIPFGSDIFAQFGDDFAAPVVGNFDPPLALRTAEAGTAVIRGTSGNDAFEFRASTTPGGWTIRVNGVEQFLGPEVRQILLEGLAGNDSLTIWTTSAEEVVEARPEGGSFRFLNGGPYSVSWSSMEQVTLNARGNNDIVYLFDNAAGNDTLVATPSYAQLTGMGYSVRANNFRQVAATSTGGRDQARLWDNPSGDDRYVGTPEYGELFGSNYYVRAENFRWVMVNARGGNDSAELFDRPGGKDYFVAMPDYARLSASTFYHSVKGFDTVTATSRGGGDGAYLYDNPNMQDTFAAEPGRAVLSTAGTTFTALGFGRVEAYSRGGQDQAILRDNATGKDRLEATPTYAVLYSPGLFTRVMGFADVVVESRGGGDSARLYGATSGLETLTAGPSAGILAGSNYRLEVRGFRWLTAYSRGARSVAELYDSAGNDIFIGRPDYSELYNDLFSVRAVGFRHVSASSTSGGVDKATLVDSALSQFPDRLEARDNWVRLSNSALDYAIELTGFAQVRSRASNAQDTKSLVGAVDWLLAEGWKEE
jgi:hypothetical protein